MASARGWVREEVHGQAPEEPTSQAAGVQHFCLDDDEPPVVKGTRPDRLADVRPQERVPRRIVEQIVDYAPVVPLLHAPVPQPVDSVVEVLKILDKSLPDVEQVIEVPKILQHTVPQRSSLLKPQMAERMVEVPRFEHVFVRRSEGALCLGVVRAAGHTWFYADLQWMVPLFSSSTEWWILPLCFRDRYAQCQTVHFGLVIDMPVIVHVKVVDISVVAQRPFPAVQFSGPPRFPSCVPLTRCSMSLLCRSSKFLGCSR